MILTRPVLIGLLAVAAGIGLAGPASAHPLGNATVNHYDGLTFHPDRIDDHAVEDIAEIPTFQRKGTVDTDGNGTLARSELTAYGVTRCAQMAAGVQVAVNGQRVVFSVQSSDYTEKPGQGGLPTGRLVCELTAPASLDRAATVDVESTWDDDGIGWHEITAVGVGVQLTDSPFPATTVSDELRRYPGDLLASPLDVRRGTVATEPGAGGSTYSAVRDLPVAGPVARALDQASRAFNDQVGTQHLTVGVGLLALLLSIALGAGHAFLPGHGKTIMAAYLVGRRGSLKDVVTVGATVTLTHTAGVLVLGLLLTTTTAFAPASAERWLGVSSGLLIAGVGVFLLVGALRRRRQPVLRAAVQQVPVSVGAHGAHDHGAHDHDGARPRCARPRSRAQPRAQTTDPGTDPGTRTRTGSGAADSSAWASPVDWSRARRRCWCCSRRSRSGARGSASGSSSATASAWLWPCPSPGCFWSGCAAVSTGGPPAAALPVPSGLPRSSLS